MDRGIPVMRMVRRDGIKEGQRREAWTAEEDKILAGYIRAHGEGKWKNVPKQTGLRRCGKACRLRWINYLRPDIKRGNITEDEKDLILRLHKLLGNRWSLIAGRLPGRTANEIKNYWNTNFAKREQEKKSNSNHKYCQNGKRTIDDSDVATVKSVPIGHAQSSPCAEQNLDASSMDFDFGDVACLEFLDLDFTQLPECDVFNMNNLNLTQQESGSNSTDSDSTRGNGNATDRHICETPKPNYSGETNWNASACFETSSYSDLGPWGDFLDSAQQCNIWN